MDVGTTGYRPGGNYTIVNCSGNATHGALLDLTGTGGKAVKNVNADLTLLPHDQSDINPVVAYIIGPNHTINLYNDGIGMPDTDQEIRVGGTRPTWRHPQGEAINSAENVTFNNYTGYPVVLASIAENCQVKSVGPIKDLGGEGNTMGSLSGTIVTASSHVGLEALERTVDGISADPNNCWNSHEGTGVWIRYELGQEKQFDRYRYYGRMVCSIPMILTYKYPTTVLSRQPFIWAQVYRQNPWKRMRLNPIGDAIFG